jgi:hypothetical protein
MFQLFEKCILFQRVTKSQSKNLTDIDLIVTDVAEFLVSEDLRALAIKYLD